MESLQGESDSLVPDLLVLINGIFFVFVPVLEIPSFFARKYHQGCPSGSNRLVICPVSGRTFRNIFF